MAANGCMITDANHRFDDPDKPITWQGFASKGPTRLGDNVWLGANVVVTSGVTIGDRVRRSGPTASSPADIPPGTIAAGAPAKVDREIDVRQTGCAMPGSCSASAARKSCSSASSIE